MNEDVTMLNLLALSENTYIKALFCILRRCVCVCVSYHWEGKVIPTAGRSPKLEKFA